MITLTETPPTATVAVVTLAPGSARQHTGSTHRDRIRVPFVVLVYSFPHLNMQKTADYGPKQH
jgi:hypothetical protein